MAPKDSKALKRSRSAASEVAADDIEFTGIPDSSVEPKSKKPKTEANSSLFVRSLPADVTNESLAEFFSQHFPVKHATVILDPQTKASRGFGFVTFADAEDALEAKNKLNNELWEGRRLVIDTAEARHREDQHDPTHKPATAASSASKPSKEQAIADAWKSPKLIIRNLPWSVKTPQLLAELFMSYGKIKFADLPKKAGRLRGFGFVTIRGQKNAENAIAGVNGKTIDGRTLAVDFAVDREEWEQQQQQDTESKPSKKEKAPKEKEAKATKEKNSDKPATEADEQLNADLEAFLKNHMGNLEEESDDDENKDDDEDEEEDDDDEEDDLESSDEESEPEERPETKPKANTNNSSTIFVRNLPFTTTDQQLKSHFVQFGPVRYARVVMDRATDRPAGTGFVCFFEEADSKACVVGAPKPQAGLVENKHSILQDETADPEGKYTLDGRLLQVAQAVSKEDASRLAADGGVKRRAGDKRRLFLLEEGQLDTRSAMYQTLSQQEIKMREQSRTQRKKLVEGNPTLHISLTRLAVRNIPSDMGSKELKQLARSACVEFAKDVKDGRREALSKEEKNRAAQDSKEAEHNRKAKKKGIVQQAKIEFESRDGAKVEESKGGKSRGYGFIEYSSHRWALMGLRWLNGHMMENSQGRKQRLIVEFAIENAQVVARRKAGEAKQNQKGPSQDKGQEQGDGAEEEQNDKAASSAGKQKGKKQKVGSQKSNKKFAFKTGGGNKGGDKKPSAGDDTKEKANSKSSEKKGGASREDVQQKLIARKRMMRKKKAHSRGKA